MMNRNTGSSQTGRRTQAVLLGDVVNEVIGGRLAARYEQSMQLQQAWDQTLPSVLTEHCRIERFLAGRLTVAVDAPGYMHELRLCRNQLRSEMNKKITCGKIKEIQLTLG